MEFKTPIRGPPEGKTLVDYRKLAIGRGQFELYHKAHVFSHLVFQEAAESSGGGRNGSLSVGLAGHIDCPIQALALCFLTAEVI